MFTYQNHVYSSLSTPRAICLAHLILLEIIILSHFVVMCIYVRTLSTQAGSSYKEEQ